MSCESIARTVSILPLLTRNGDYIPVYFQACQAATPIHSSVNTLPTALGIPVGAVTTGITIKVTGKYKPVNYAGWAISIIGFGLMTLLKADASTAQWVCFQGIAAVGVGIVWTGTVFPILAPLSVERIAAALGFCNFCRTFAQVRPLPLHLLPLRFLPSEQGSLALTRRAPTDMGHCDFGKHPPERAQEASARRVPAAVPRGRGDRVRHHSRHSHARAHAAGRGPRRVRGEHGDGVEGDGRLLSRGLSVVLPHPRGADAEAHGRKVRSRRRPPAAGRGGHRGG